MNGESPVSDLVDDVNELGAQLMLSADDEGRGRMCNWELSMRLEALVARASMHVTLPAQFYRRLSEISEAPLQLVLYTPARNLLDILSNALWQVKRPQDQQFRAAVVEADMDLLLDTVCTSARELQVMVVLDTEFDMIPVVPAQRALGILVFIREMAGKYQLPSVFADAIDAIEVLLAKPGDPDLRMAYLDVPLEALTALEEQMVSSMVDSLKL